MTKTEKILAAKLLDAASESYSNHGCNDLDKELIAGISSTDRKAIELGIKEWNGGDEDEECSFDHLPDWLLMSYLADKIKEEIESE